MSRGQRYLFCTVSSQLHYFPSAMKTTSQYRAVVCVGAFYSVMSGPGGDLFERILWDGNFDKQYWMLSNVPCSHFLIFYQHQQSIMYYYYWHKPISEEWNLWNMNRTFYCTSSAGILFGCSIFLRKTLVCSQIDICAVGFRPVTKATAIESFVGIFNSHAESIWFPTGGL